MNKNSDELSIRLNKFIAKSGLCSRREADVFISNGRVSVNDNKVIKMGILVNKNDLVKVDNKRIFPEKKNICSFK